MAPASHHGKGQIHTINIRIIVRIIVTARAHTHRNTIKIRIIVRIIRITTIIVVGPSLSSSLLNPCHYHNHNDNHNHNQYTDCAR